MSLIAVENSFYDKAGRFALFALTCGVFAAAIITFARWVDSVARLGRLGTTIRKVEAATAAALQRRKRAPALGGGLVPPGRKSVPGAPFYGTAVGYVRHVDISALQELAEQAGVQVEVALR